MNAYGLWLLVIINSLIFVIFAFSFSHPKTKRDWRSFGAFSAFVVALFTEMYGFPLTIYLFSGWLIKRLPGVDLFSHDAGHLWYTLLGWKGDPHSNPLHMLSNVLIFGGFLLLAYAWPVLYRAQSAGKLAVEGPYRRIQHPQYAGFIIIMLGFLFQWPTLLTALMFPVLVFMYVRLGRVEEREAARDFGETWVAYAAATPRWFPRLGRGVGHGASPTSGARSNHS